MKRKQTSSKWFFTSDFFAFCYTLEGHIGPTIQFISKLFGFGECPLFASKKQLHCSKDSQLNSAKIFQTQYFIKQHNYAKTFSKIYKSIFHKIFNKNHIQKEHSEVNPLILGRRQQALVELNILSL